MIYIVVFLLSCAFFYLSEKSHSKLLRNALAAIGILIPCLLAGMRADIIGTDVKVYAEPLYNAAKQSQGLSSFMSQKWYAVWQYKYVSNFEIGFTLMIYLIEKIGGSFGTVLFFIQAMIIAPIYVGLRKLKKPYPICFGMLVFYFLFYNTSLNMMRQWIAMAILFMGFPYLEQRNEKKYFIYVAVACLFHMSSIIGVVVFFVYRSSQKKRDDIKIANIKFVESVAPIKILIYGYISLISLNLIALILEQIGLARFAGYIQGDSPLYFLPNQIILRLPILILFIIRWNKMLKEDKLTSFYGSMFVLDLLASQLMSINAHAFRIGVFFSEYNIISYSALIYAGNRKYPANRYATLLYVLIYISYYWVFYQVINGTHATFPYVFA